MKKLQQSILLTLIIGMTISCGEKKQKQPNNVNVDSSATENQSILDTEQDTAISLSSFPIAVIDSDTLMEQYLYVQELKKQLEKRIKEYEANFDKKVKSFQREVEEFQKNARYLTSTELQKKQEELMQKEQNLAQLKEELGSKLMNEEAELSKALQFRVQDYLKRHKERYNYRLILTKSAMSNVLYADSTIDITKEIVKGLNAEYKKNNP